MLKLRNMNNDKHEPGEDQKLRHLRVVTLPVFLIVAPAAGYFIGRFLDRHLGSEPYLMYAGIVIGLLAVVREVYRVIKELKDQV